MNRRLVKEFRPLLLPWSVAALTILFPLLLSIFYHNLWRESSSSLFGISSALFIGSLAFMAAASFGMEFHERTLGLLLSQPVTRYRLWAEKLAVLVVAAAGLCILELPLLKAARMLGSMEMLMGAVLVAVLVCSGPYWTLVARSSIGGAAFALSAPFLLIALGKFTIDKLYGPARTPDLRVISICMLVGALCYSACLLWLGLRKFSSLELRDVVSREFSLPDRVPGFKLRWAALLLCSPDSPLLNLLRKEVRLQQPVFLVAFLFTCCSLLTAALMLLQSTHDDTYQNIFSLLIAFYVPLSLLLAGCVSLSEEKTLGLTAWHLTLPISARRQWFLKLLVSGLTALVCSLIIPLLLASLIHSRFQSGPLYLFGQDVQYVLLLLAVLVPTLAFWSATLASNTLRAVFVSVLAFATLVLCAAIATWCAQAAGGLQSRFVEFLMVQLQLPTYYLENLKVENWGVCFVVSVIWVTCLVQSFLQFRYAKLRNAALFRYSGILIALVLALAFLCADFSVSLRSRSYEHVRDQVGIALKPFLAKHGPISPDETLTISAGDLEKDAVLSSSVKRWLRGAVIKLSIAKPSHASAGRVVIGEIHFPNGMVDFCSREIMMIPPPSERPPGRGYGYAPSKTD